MKNLIITLIATLTTFAVIAADAPAKKEAAPAATTPAVTSPVAPAKKEINTAKKVATPTKVVSPTPMQPADKVVAPTSK